MRIKPWHLIAAAFGLLFYLLLYVAYGALASEQIWSRCNVALDDVRAVSYWSESTRELADNPELWRNGEVVRARPAIWQALASQGDLLPFDTADGFDIGEASQALGWQVLVLRDGTYRYALWTQGMVSGDFYVYTTNSLEHYVAAYGGAESFHVLCGTWIVPRAGA